MLTEGALHVNSEGALHEKHTPRSFGVNEVYVEGLNTNYRIVG